jgi:hypothetical protein
MRTKLLKILLPGLGFAMWLFLLIFGGSLAHAQKVTMPTFAGSQAVPEVGAPISKERTRAFQLFRSLTGLRLPIDDQRLKEMEAKLQAGDLFGATGIATADRAFYDLRVKDLGKKMSNRDETVSVELNDFAATFVGVVRDSDTTSAKELLTGNFLYKADITKTMIANAAGVQTQTVRDVEVADRLISNNHYGDIERNNLSLKDVLIRADGQKFVTGSGATATASALPENAAAGLITSRAFISAHAAAGTNRRLVEYSFKEFLCTKMEELSDISLPDDKIGQDVNRAPGGDLNKFQTTCKGCHSQLDSLILI